MENLLKRDWCTKCQDYKLFTVALEEKDCKCNSCNNMWSQYKYSDIPEHKIIEQRERYKKAKREQLINMMNIYNLNYNILNDILNEDKPFGKVRIIESDAGQKKIDDDNQKLREIERERERNLIAEANKMKSTYGRNDKCPCGSGDKFKKCCMVTKYKGLI